MELNNQVEINILSSAEKVFYKKGKNGTSMQDIADEAGITRTSLNYYYRSKDKLFEAVFRNAMLNFVPKMAEFFKSDLLLMDYLPEMVDIIIDSMIENPQIPVFVLQELSSNPERIPQMWKELGINPEHAIEHMKSSEHLSNLPFDPRHLILNIISLCIFPFAAKSIILPLVFQGDENAYINAMHERKKLIPEMIKNMIKPIEP